MYCAPRRLETANNNLHRYAIMCYSLIARFPEFDVCEWRRYINELVDLVSLADGLPVSFGAVTVVWLPKHTPSSFLGLQCAW